MYKFNSAKPVHSNILDYIILLLYSYTFLQNGIILSYLRFTLIRCHQSMQTSATRNCYMELTMTTSRLLTILLRMWFIISHTVFPEISREHPTSSDHLFLNNPFVLISWRLSMPKSIKFLQHGLLRILKTRVSV